MKIVQILQGIENLSAGPTHSVGYLSHYLARHRHDSIVMAMGKSSGQWPHESKLELHDDAWNRFHLVSPKTIKALKKHAEVADIFHGHGIWRSANLFPLALSGQRPGKIVWSPRGMMSPWAWSFKSRIKKPFWVALQRPALQFVDCFHATAENELDDIRRLKFTQPVAIIPNGVETPVLSDTIEKKRRIVFLSRIHEKKGLHLLIPVWRALQHEFPEWELHIAGKVEQGYGQRMVTLTEELGAERVHFRGEVLGDNKTELLAEASVFVLPTFSENFGIAVAEAMAHGTPVITTTETPWQEVVERNCGWCIRPEEEELRRAINEALSLPVGRLIEMGANGRSWMERDYSWTAVTMMMERLYLWLQGHGERPEFVNVHD